MRKSALYSLEIVREIACGIYLMSSHCLSFAVVNIELLWFLLCYVNQQLLIIQHWHLDLSLLLTDLLKTLNCHFFIGFSLFTLALLCMLQDLVVYTLDGFAFGAAKDKLFKNFLHCSMHFDKWISWLALFAFPFALSCYQIVAAVKAVDWSTFLAFFWLVYYEFANFTQKVIYCCS